MLTLYMCAHTLLEHYPPVYLLPKVVQCWRALWDSIVTINLHLLAGENVAIQEELTHELLPVVYIQVAVALQRVTKLTACCHDDLHTLHEEVTHVCQVSHVLHVSL